LRDFSNEPKYVPKASDSNLSTSESEAPTADQITKEKKMI
jgi:hypothetical protein